MPTDDTLAYTSILSGTLSSLPLPAGSGLESPDRRDGLVYRCPPVLHLALDVALATGRPLLVRGEPGTGKSSFAAFVARNLGWRYYEYAVTSGTEARDLLWRFDAVRRLADAQARAALGPGALNDPDYIEPGPLWWAFDQADAARRGQAEGVLVKPLVEPFARLNAERDRQRAVVLIDEIDKADPDVPNALLVPLGSLRFHVSDLGKDVERVMPSSSDPNAAPAPRRVESGSNGLLMVITTNEERELPAAFVRRCITVRLDPPGPDELVEIAGLHFRRPDKPFDAGPDGIARRLTGRLQEARDEARAAGLRVPGTAEYLDALRACLSLGITPESSDPLWAHLKKISLVKK